MKIHHELGTACRRCGEIQVEASLTYVAANQGGDDPETLKLINRPGGMSLVNTEGVRLKAVVSDTETTGGFVLLHPGESLFWGEFGQI